MASSTPDRKPKSSPVVPPAKLPPLRTPPKSGAQPAVTVEPAPPSPTEQTIPAIPAALRAEAQAAATLRNSDVPTPPSLPEVSGPEAVCPPPLPVAPPPLPPALVLEPWSAFSVVAQPKSELEVDLAEPKIAPPPFPAPSPAKAPTPPPLPAAGPPTAATISELGQVGPYVLKQLIGEGGMGLVYKAEDAFLKRAVAVKVMKPEIAADDRSWKLFLTEAQATAALKDDRIATIYQIGEDHGRFFLAMELLKGESLESRLKRGPMSLEQALWVVREAALGLKVAHNAGFVHRDIKPANLWLETELATGALVDPLQKFRPGEMQGGRETQYARVKILDFGLVRLEQDGDGKRRTSIVGTPAYMAPEQAAGRKADARSDIFSLGVVLFRLLTGRLPFEGETPMEIITALATKTAPLVSQFNPNVPPPLVELVQRMLSRDPMGRPNSAGDIARLIDGIEKFALTPPEPLKRRKRFLFIGVGIAVVGLVAVFGFAGWWFFLSGSDDAGKVPVVAGAPANKVLDPTEAANAIGDRVTVEFTVGAIRRTSDQAYLYEKPPPAVSEGTMFRVVLPGHLIGQMRRRGASWPEALDGATLRLRGTISREGRYAELLAAELDQFEKLDYKDRTPDSPSKPAEKPKPVEKPKPAETTSAEKPAEKPAEPTPLPVDGPRGRAPDPQISEDLSDATKKAARDMLSQFLKGKAQKKDAPKGPPVTKFPK